MSQSGLAPLSVSQKIIVEIFDLASFARRRGKARSLRDTTILFPIDALLIESITLALRQIAEGALGSGQSEMEELLQPVLSNPNQLRQFETALKSLRERLAS